MLTQLRVTLFGESGRSHCVDPPSPSLFTKTTGAVFLTLFFAEKLFSLLLIKWYPRNNRTGGGGGGGGGGGDPFPCFPPPGPPFPLFFGSHRATKPEKVSQWK